MPGEGEVVVKVRYCGICGGDLHIFEQGAGVGPGHEYSGDIAAVGPGVDSWEVGDRVAVEPLISCGDCFWCRQGRPGLCELFYARLLENKGGFATYATVKAANLHRLPENLSYEQGALIEPTTCALHAVRVSELKKGDSVAVLGLGPIGQLIARVARVAGAGAVYASELSKARIELARNSVEEVVDAGLVDPVARIIELTGGKGPDIVFECAGTEITSQQSIALVRKGGTVVVEAICLEPVHLPFSNIALKELIVKGSQCFTPGEYASALELIRHGRIDVAPLATCSMPLECINEAFEKSSKGEGGKILVEP